MILSQASDASPDPLSDVLEVLGARVVRRTRLEAAGSWALAFPARDRLKFVAMLRGAQWMLLPGQPPRRLEAGDVCLIGRTAYAVASDPALTPVDGTELFGAAGGDVARLGGDDTVSIGGSVTFADSSADFLVDMLPAFLTVPRGAPAAGSIATLLALLDGEAAEAKMGRAVVSARLADVLVVEAIRAHAAEAAASGTGWLGALADARLGRALRAVHADIAQPWTVARLAGIAGMSRASFAAQFAARVGQAPLAYVRAWRLTRARAALARGGGTVAEIADAVGYSSQSAFGHAFRRAFGASPKAIDPL